MRWQTRIFGLVVVGATAGSLVVMAACSSDDSPAAAAGPDGGSEAATQVDSGVTNRCANVLPPARACTAKACAQTLGEPAICVGGQCTKLKSLECQDVIGPAEDDNVMVLGVLLNQRGSDSVNGKIRQHSVELAVNEINAAGGLHTADNCGRRPVLAVVCDDSNALKSPDAGADGGAFDRRAAARHLATDLKASGIVGAYNSANTIEIATNITDDAKTLLIAPTAGSQEITTVANATQDGVRMLWRTVPSDALQAKAIAAYGAGVQASIVKGGAPLKAAIINRGDAFGNGLRDGVSSALILNGKPFSDASNAANTIVRTYSTTSPITPSYASVVADVVAFQPDVIYWFGLGEFAPNVLAPYEDANAAGVKPIWVSSSSGQRAEVIAAAKTRVSLRPRLRGTSAQLTTPLSQDFFNFRYKDIYKDTAQLTFGQTQAYDAVYLIAFGAQATKPTYDPIQSQAVAAGLSKLVGGTQIIDVGPASFTKGLEALRVGETVDFNGASGPLDFDPKVGEALGDYSVWCVTTDSNTGEAAYLNATGLVWHYKTGVLEGTFNCPQ